MVLNQFHYMLYSVYKIALMVVEDDSLVFSEK